MKLTDGDLEMLKTAVSAMVETWSIHAMADDPGATVLLRGGGEVPTSLYNQQHAAWQALLDKLDEVEP